MKNAIDQMNRTQRASFARALYSKTIRLKDNAATRLMLERIAKGKRQ